MSTSPRNGNSGILAALGRFMRTLLILAVLAFAGWMAYQAWLVASAQLDELRVEMAAEKEARVALEERLASMEARVDEVSSRADSLARQQSDLARDAEDVSPGIGRIEEALITLQSDLVAQRSDIDALGGQVDTLAGGTAADPVFREAQTLRGLVDAFDGALALLDEGDVPRATDAMSSISETLATLPVRLRDEPAMVSAMRRLGLARLALEEEDDRRGAARDLATARERIEGLLAERLLPSAGQDASKEGGVGALGARTPRPPTPSGSEDTASEDATSDDSEAASLETPAIAASATPESGAGIGGLTAETPAASSTP